MSEKTQKIVLYGAPWCPDCSRSKKFLEDNNILYQYINIDEDPSAARKVEEINKGNRSIPTIVLENGTVLVEPSNDELANNLGIGLNPTQTVSLPVEADVVIIGAGPAGLTAAIYTTRDGKKTVLLEKKVPGGQAATTDLIENYPGFPDGISGYDFSELMRKQAEKFGAQIDGAEVVSIADNGEVKEIKTKRKTYKAKAVIIAVGTEYKHSGAKGEEELIGKGIHFCATCDGPFYKEKEIIVIGGGNSAFQEALYLAKFTSKITILIRGEKARASDILLQKILAQPEKFTMLFNTSVSEFVGKNTLESVLVRNTTTNIESNLKVAGVFEFIGLIPQTAFLKNFITLNELGYVQANSNMQTSIPGVFVAGDCRQGATAQVAAAVGEGATVAIHAREYLDG